MKIIHRYLVTSYLKLLIIVTIASVSLFLSVDFFEKIDDLIEVKAPVSVAITYFALKLPFMVSQVFAISVMLSCLFTYSLMHKHREIIAMKASGISPREYILPAIVITLCLAILFFIFREYVERRLTVKSEGLWWSSISHSRKKSPKWRESGIWYATKDTIFHLRYYNPEDRTFYRVSIFLLSDDFKLQKQITARSMKWTGGSWELSNAIVLSFHNKEVSFTRRDRISINIKEAPEDFMIIRSLPENLEINRIIKIISMMKKEGINPRPYILEVNIRLAEAFMVLLAGTIAVVVANHSMIAPGIIKIITAGCLAYGLSFGLFQLGTAMASAGYVSPYFGVWFGPIITASLIALQKNRIA